MLIGPSGCGKTTTMRIINRMIEPDGGTHHRRRPRRHATSIRVELRRSIGYVIQQVGLFPHWTIAENIATVPQLLGWDERADRARASTSCWRSSAWTRRRTATAIRASSPAGSGSASASRARSPPTRRCMLMDEPFGAIDPITRARLQDEFLRILQRRSRRRSSSSPTTSTRRSRWATASRSCATARSCSTTRPRRSSRAPADAFVEAFVGADRALKRLALDPARRPRSMPRSCRRHRRTRSRHAHPCATRSRGCSSHGVDALASTATGRRRQACSRWPRIRARARARDALTAPRRAPTS